jgi:hypothetical protein
MLQVRRNINMNIGLIDVDSIIPNLALMKISNYYKSNGCNVEFVQSGKNYDKIFASAIFTRSRNECQKLQEYYGDKIKIGGTGWDIKKELPEEIEKTKPDYDLYKVEDIASRMKGIGTKEHKYKKAAEIVNAGMGFTSRGCIRNCGFCFVPKKEGKFHQMAEIKDLINPRSNVLILHDNNLTADPHCIDKLHEIKDRKLIVDINQGCDVRLMTDEIAQALSEVKHLRSIHYAWDLMNFEDQVLRGIKTLSKHIKPYNHMCFMLVGFNTTFEEDMYRFSKLDELGIRPYVMKYNEKKDDERLNKFTRWVDSMIYKAVPDFEEYEPWKKIKDSCSSQISMF